MREQIEARLQQLKSEFDSGKRLLADLDARQAEVSNALLRISGAIQVLEEELAKANDNSPESDDSDSEELTQTNNASLVES